MSAKSLSTLFNIRTKFVRTFGQPAGSCGDPESPDFLGGDRIGARYHDGNHHRPSLIAAEPSAGPLRFSVLGGDKWTSTQVKSFNLLRSKSKAN